MFLVVLSLSAFLSSYLDGIALSIHGLVPDEEVEVLHAPGQPPGGLVAHLGRLLDGDGRWNDELGLLVAGIAKLGVAEAEEEAIS